MQHILVEILDILFVAPYQTSQTLRQKDKGRLYMLYKGSIV